MKTEFAEEKHSGMLHDASTLYDIDRVCHRRTAPFLGQDRYNPRMVQKRPLEESLCSRTLTGVCVKVMEYAHLSHQLGYIYVTLHPFLGDVVNTGFAPTELCRRSSHLTFSLFVCSILRSQLILALEWKDPARDYFDVLATTFQHPSFLELENNAQVRQLD